VKEEIKFGKMGGLVPVVIQDFYSGDVLMLGFMNKIAYEKTLKTRKVTFYSRTRKKLWTKGETSGNILIVKKIYLDCDKDSILVKVIPKGPTCHTKNKTCFFREVL